MLTGYRAYRCRDCHHRFRRLAQREAPQSKAEPRKESRKRRRALQLREFCVYAAALVAFVAVVFVITGQRG